MRLTMKEALLFDSIDPDFEAKKQDDFREMGVEIFGRQWVF